MPDEMLAKWKARFAAAEERLGPYCELRSPSVFSGYLQFYVGPDSSSVDEMAPAGEQQLQPGGAYWAVARFESGDAHVAVVLYGSGPMDQATSLKKLDDASSAPILTDVRIYVPVR